jgi:hypothetical protein
MTWIRQPRGQRIASQEPRPDGEYLGEFNGWDGVGNEGGTAG